LTFASKLDHHQYRCHVNQPMVTTGGGSGSLSDQSGNHLPSADFLTDQHPGTGSQKHI